MSGEFPIANPLVSKGYSLDADMLSGWRPPNHRKPYPLIFESEIEYPENKLCVYTGYKPADSFIIHKVLSDGTQDTYPFDYSEPALVSYFSKKVKEHFVLYKIPEAMPEDCIIFDSKFECGNLDRVEFISKDEYDLYLRIDTNSSGHMHWFYFSVTGIKYKRTIKFNIVNFTRSTGLYAAGMKPRVFSVQEVRFGINNGWCMGGENITFSQSKLLKPNSRKPFFQLSFTYKFNYPNDKVWFATGIPYTYCRLEKIFKLLKSEKNSYIKTSSLCKSLAMIDIPLITITNPNVSKDNKKVIIAVARVHPAETVGSWVMEGFIRFISSKHPEAAMLRNRFVFKIVPMLNPDGVIAGNSRTSMSGNDLNRTCISPSPENHPEIFALKELVRELEKEFKNRVFLFVDMHGHFSKKGSFIYGPYFPIHNTMYYKTKIIPRLIGERTEMFRYHSSKFHVSRTKKKAARAVMNNEFKIFFSYTLETSYYGYLSQSRETVAFTTENLFSLGEKLARSIFEYSSMIENENKRFKARKNTKFKIEKPEFPEISNIENFDFEIPHLSYGSTTNMSRSPTDNFSTIFYKKETHAKRSLEDWINVISI